MRAASEEELEDRLDELGNPENCTWSVYKGPLWIEFDLPVKFSTEGRDHTQPLQPEDIKLDEDSVKAFAKRATDLEESVPNTDMGAEMIEAVFRKLFPALYKECWVEEKLDLERLREALLVELEPYIKDSWQGASLQKKTDPVSRLAVTMDIPVKMARRYYDEPAVPPRSGSKKKPKGRR